MSIWNSRCREAAASQLLSVASRSSATGTRSQAEPNRWQELRPLLDEELSRLPDKYRFVLIACDLEGHTRKEVARALDLPEGTVASRLARARAMLANRLKRRNLAMSAAALVAVLAEKATATCMPAALAASTTRAAALLAAYQ